MKDKFKTFSNINLKNILFKGDNIYKLYCFPIFEKIDDEINPPEVLLNKEGNSKNLIWSIGLILYELYEGKEFNYENNLDILNNKINEDINEKYKNNCELEEENLLQNLIKECLILEQEKRISFKKYFSHPFFNHIYSGKIEDKNKIYNENEKREYLNINVINLPKISFKELKLHCYEDNEKFYSTFEDFSNELIKRISNEEKEIIIFLVSDKTKDENKIKSILKKINNSIENDNGDMPFILFLFDKNKDNLEENILKMIEEEELEKIDNRFLFYCKFSNNINDLKIIEKKIYRAFSYFNECGDIFNLDKIEIDLRENIFDFYFNIICIARSKMGKSTFINEYINSCKKDNKREIRAKEGRDKERECSTKIAKYYLDNLPIKLIDIIGYNGKTDTVNKLKYIINEMSILLLKNEIHLILYLIKFEPQNLFFENEVEIFETLKLNAIKPKILFIRTNAS